MLIVASSVNLFSSLLKNYKHKKKFQCCESKITILTYAMAYVFTLWLMYCITTTPMNCNCLFVFLSFKEIQKDRFFSF